MFRSAIFCLCIAMSFVHTVFAERYVQVIPAYPENRISYDALNGPIDPVSSKRHSWQRISHILQKHNITLLIDHFQPSLFSTTQCIICCNIPRWIPHWQKKLAQARAYGIPLYLIASEPPSFIPEQHTPQVWSLFDKVFTWNDQLIDHKKFFKINYSPLQPFPSYLPPFAQRKLCTMICGDKRSSHPDELYSARRGVISFFEKKSSQDFDFYGIKWNKHLYTTYRGTVGDKIPVLQKYAFCFCYENMKNIPGYISEKIFDCFASGCVPIYWGASNIQEHIPPSCYILREDFKSMDELYAFLSSMKEEEYNQYLAHIKTFVESKEAYSYSKEFFIENLCTHLLP